MAQIDAYGIAVAPPPGWDAQIYCRAPQPNGVVGQRLNAAPETPMPILHLANFGLPADRGDYGGGAVQVMRPGGVFVSVLQHHPSEVATPLFRRRSVPWPLQAADFDPDAMPRRLADRIGHQSFFTAAGRPYCLYIVLAGLRLRNVLVPVVNRALADVSFH